MRKWAAILILLTVLALPVRADCAHSYVQLRQEPTCDSPGMVWEECTICQATRGYASLPALGHDFAEWYVMEEPTCTRDGVEVRDCVRCGHQEQRTLAHAGHDYTQQVVAPTCTARGYIQHQCELCGDRFRSDYTDPLGHRYDPGVILREPSETATGRTIFTCKGCADTYQTIIPVLENPFVDLAEDAFYRVPVLWAVDRGITSGIDDTHFGPEVLCNRAQVVLFLWRLAGKPEPTLTAHPFADIPQGAFYEKAVLWALEENIATGVDATHFGPNESCMRAQVVTFLHRFHGCPEPTEITHFPDVRETDFYYKAVQWAAERNITRGMDGGNFCPTALCNRAHIVTFIYRDRLKP